MAVWAAALRGTVGGFGTAHLVRMVSAVSMAVTTESLRHTLTITAMKLLLATKLCHWEESEMAEAEESNDCKKLSRNGFRSRWKWVLNNMEPHHSGNGF
jgi:hypothetical protein